jgi:SAM-dependent methyltransferase
MISNQPSRNITCDRNQRIWAEKPGELAIITYNYLKESQGFKNRKDIFILDLGCGYAQDAIFLAQNLPCHILALDNSQEAIDIARRSLTGDLEKRIELLCYDFSKVSDKYDVIFISNLYHLLKPDDMSILRETVKRCLKSDGVFFLSTLSVSAPRHFYRTSVVLDQTSGSSEGSYLHLSTREELENDFDFLNISALYEREHSDPDINQNKNKVSWILIGRLK